MSDAQTKHSIPTQALAWSFAAGAIALIAAIAAGLVALVSGAIKEMRR